MFICVRIWLLNSAGLIGKGNKIREKIMKVVGIKGSPRREGNTSIIKAVFKELEKNGIETE
jgi:hypothetical protein